MVSPYTLWIRLAMAAVVVLGFLLGAGLVFYIVSSRRRNPARGFEVIESDVPTSSVEDGADQLPGGRL